MSHTQKFNNSLTAPKAKANQQLHRRQETKHSDSSEDTDKKIYITVSYDDRTTAKMLGAKWCEDMRCWYCLENSENAQKLIRRYPYVERTYLYVSYDDKDTAKSMGAYYCGISKRWYAPRPSEQSELINKFGSLPGLPERPKFNKTSARISQPKPTFKLRLPEALRSSPVSPIEIEISA